GSMRTSIVIGGLLLLAACGQPTVTGNAEGGVMSGHATGEQGAFIAAQTHCQRYGRDARFNAIMPGGSATFECVKKS
ncbi:MAG: hypothetical protein AB7F22_27185, partial [Reyranella sp.]|uniref:hypothetical protein n=2 Tax=Reyranella sp. TaxID=1929291 RepID=UPI003D11FE47